ncbi:non-ribosomal peptide synthetase [Vibrio tapetis]|uniref:Carrier domain-containing protein n=1 Tax=Vibrio tapetis subsp. tapetis TaxID=1671868 RepID=A0A2N8ZIX4_9VIBR|nr:non-ribosomal peptide synthetase [Vibrio tapetis]SON51853.1 conserved protein of unknown function [Vibrio tapetis subsp. tapetis]
MLVEQTSPLEREQGAHYFLLPVGRDVSEFSALNSRPIQALDRENVQAYVRHLLSVGASMTGQGYVECNVLMDEQWHTASLEWSLRQQKIKQFCFEAAALPKKNVRTIVSFDSKKPSELHVLLGLNADALVVSLGRDNVIYFTDGYDAKEIELFIQHCESEDLLGNVFMVGETKKCNPDHSLYSTFRNQALSNPNKLAIISTNVKWTYAELLAETEAIISQVVPYLESNDPIALYLERDVYQIVATLACHALGCAAVPIYYDTPLERVKQQLSLVECQSIITSVEKANELQSKTNVITIEYLLEAKNQSTSRQISPQQLRPLALEKPSYVYFTSGSEGMPKGVALPGLAIARIIDQPNFLGPMTEQIISYIANLAFDASALELWGALYNGATLAILNKDEVLDVELLSRKLREFNVTTSFFTSGLFNRISDADALIFDSLSYVMFGGEKVSVSHVQRALSLAPNAQFIHCYGPTENGIFTTTHVVESNSVNYLKDIPIGKPVTGTYVALLDNDFMPVPQGKVGQLVCFGEGLATGYVGSKGQTEEKFIDFKGHRGYLTGDYARFSAMNNIEFVGRVDSQIKLNGFRIELGEIESAIRNHAKISTAYVRLSTQKRQIQAFITSGSDVDIDDVRLMLSNMPHYMQPTDICWVPSIPLNPNGKIDQKALDAIIDQKRAVEPIESVSRTMRKVLSLYEALLCAPVTRIDSSLFELGGNSLHLMQLLTELRETFSHSIELSFLAENSSPVEVCDWVELQQWNQMEDDTTEEWTF